MQEFQAGAAPSYAAEVARLEALARDSQLAIDTVGADGSDTSIFESHLATYVLEAKKLHAR